jgi:tripartite-type tricarboxylate transporter receptor subunit TctC
MSVRNTSRRRFLTVTAAGLAAMGLPHAHAADKFPSQPVRLIVGTAASGLNDMVARLIAPIMEKELGQPVLVENRPGAANKLALGLVAKAAPDGHMLLVSSSAVMATAVTHTRMPANPVTDLAHICMIADGYFTFSINSKIPARNAAEFVALAKQNPNMKYGASGAGSAIHLAGELFLQRAGIKMKAVQYVSAGQRVADALAGEIQMTINAIQVTGQHIQSGDLRGLFVASREKEPGFPDIPTSFELGYADLDSVSNWFALHAPKGTPDPVIRTLHAAAVKAINDPSVRDKLIAGGLRPIGDTPDKLLERLKSDQRIFGAAAREANIKIDE